MADVYPIETPRWACMVIVIWPRRTAMAGIPRLNAMRRP